MSLTVFVALCALSAFFSWMGYRYFHLLPGEKNFSAPGQELRDAFLTTPQSSNGYLLYMGAGLGTWLYLLSVFYFKPFLYVEHHIVALTFFAISSSITIYCWQGQFSSAVPKN